MRNLLFIFILSFTLVSQGQNISPTSQTYQSIRPKKKKKDSLELTAKNYKRITLWQDTIAIDTTLSLKKYYRHNPLREDTFGYMPFPNMGQPYNALQYDERTPHNSLQMGAIAKDFLYVKAEDIPYFYVPTPFTELMYKNGIEEGQVLDALFTVNFLPELNFSIGHKGLSSLGKYQNSAAESENFHFGSSFCSTDKKYIGKAHYASFSISTQENGGISRPIEQFESGNAQFLNRETLDVFLTNVSTRKISERYFLHHQYRFLNPQITSQKQITLKHQFFIEYQIYDFEQSNSNKYLGVAYLPSTLHDRISFRQIYNELGAELELPFLGKTYLFGKAQHYRYQSPNILYLNGIRQKREIQGTDYSIGAAWKNRIKGFTVDIQGQQNLLGKMAESFLVGKLSFDWKQRFHLSAGASLRSSSPTFNQLLYQSDYKSYQWNHLEDFGHIFTQTLFSDLKTPWIDASLDVSHIYNFTYFASENSIETHIAQPVQFHGSLPYFKLILHQESSLGKFTLDNQLMLQHVVQETPILNVPRLVTRNTLYFSTYLFDKAMFLQTGLTFNFFSSYYADRYHPLLSEFTSQQQTQIGGFPRFDYFVNAKVKTMRIFVSAEHFNAPITGYHYYSAPYVPFRDLTIRFGVVWNFFS